MSPNPSTPPAFDTLEALYDQHAEAIYRFVLGMLGRCEDAEDAVQTIWLDLARAGLDRVRDPRAYLWTAARNRVRTTGRRRALSLKRLVFLEDEAPAETEMLPATENPDFPAERRRDVQRAILKLPTRLREMVVLVGFEGFTLHEASERLEIPAGTAASRYRRAVEKLRALLKEPA